MRCLFASNAAALAFVSDCDALIFDGDEIPPLRLDDGVLFNGLLACMPENRF